MLKVLLHVQKNKMTETAKHALGEYPKFKKHIHEKAFSYYDHYLKHSRRFEHDYPNKLHQLGERVVAQVRQTSRNIQHGETNRFRRRLKQFYTKAYKPK